MRIGLHVLSLRHYIKHPLEWGWRKPELALEARPSIFYFTKSQTAFSLHCYSLTLPEREPQRGGAGGYLLHVVVEGDAHALLVPQHLTGHECVEDSSAGQRQAEVEAEEPPVLHVLVELWAEGRGGGGGRGGAMWYFLYNTNVVFLYTRHTKQV